MLTIDFTQLRSAEHETWMMNRRLMQNIVPAEAGFRGCIGIGLMLDSTSEHSWLEVPSLNGKAHFIPDSTMKWLSIVDIPAGNFRLSQEKPRIVHWASSRPTLVRYGMPTLMSKEESAFDFYTIPYDRVQATDANGRAFLLERGPSVLSPTEHTQLFRAFNSIEMAMTSTAFFNRATWRSARSKVFEMLDQPYDESAAIMLFGERMFSCVPPPEAWMPKCYLGFPEYARKQLYDRAVHMPNNTVSRSPAFCGTFLRAVDNQLGYAAPFTGKLRIRYDTYYSLPVKVLELTNDSGDMLTIRFTRNARVLVTGQRFHAGQILAEESLRLPSNWNDLTAGVRWTEVVPSFSGGPLYLDAFLRIWWERECLNLRPGQIHIPAQLAAGAAFGNSIDDAVLWDVSACEPYFRTDCDCYIFPTLWISHWKKIVGTLPGEIGYDFVPQDTRCKPYAARF